MIKMSSDNNWVVVPAYNEEYNILSVIEKINKYTSNLVVVDDGSKDNTHLISSKITKHALKFKLNLGKGCALRAGCDYALSKGAKNIVVIDADGQHNPDLIPVF